jgi:regulatory protein
MRSGRGQHRTDKAELSPEQVKRMEERAAARELKRKENWSALNYILWLLGRREYSRAELMQKLKIKEVSEEDAEKVLDKALDLGLQSDVRFLASKVRVQKEHGKGPIYIRATLRQHDLPDEAVGQALGGEENDWLGAAYDLAERKFGAGPYNREVGVKVFNLLLRRGFTFDHAKKVVSVARTDTDEGNF